MVKRFLQFFLSFLFLLIATRPVMAVEPTLHFFWGKGCPHCAKEKIFLDLLEKKYPQLVIREYEISQSQENQDLLIKFAKDLNVEVGGVPFTVIDKKYFVGYRSDSTTGKEIESAVKVVTGSDVQDFISDITPSPKMNLSDVNSQTDESFNIPIFGEIKTKNLSLPILTLLVAFIDGFNPCAVWTLLFLISLLLGMKDRKRMWILGTAFVVTSALIYYLFLSAWLNLFLFLGLIVWVRVLIGIVALGAGYHYLKDFFKNKNGGCEVMGDTKRQKIFEKLKNITHKRQFLLALGGIILLAIAVNLVELICSAGLPAVYTKILSSHNLPFWQYNLYLFFYIIIFMIDDLFIFFTAMITLKVVGIESKYARFSHLIGGILILIIGLLLLFKPEWLMFG